MDQVTRLVDGDLTSLQRRIDRLLAQRPGECSVLRFTYWYTARPPMHEAILIRLPSAEAA